MVSGVRVIICSIRTKAHIRVKGMYARYLTSDERIPAVKAASEAGSDSIVPGRES